MNQQEAEYQHIQHAAPTVEHTKAREADSIEKLPYGLINAFIIIFTVSDRNRLVLLNHFLYHRFARDISGNISIDTTSQPCGNESDRDTSESDSQRVQRMTSSMIMNFELVVSLLGVLGSLFLGTFSTSLGRKAQLLIPISGYTSRALSILAVAFWDLDLSWLYVGCATEGIMGGAPGVYLGVFLYVSDITPRNRKRTLGLALLEGIRGFMGSGINIATGQMIQRTTFFVPASFTACGATICVIMACLMPDRMPVTPVRWSPRVVKKSLGALLSPIRKLKDHRVRRMVLVAAIAYFLGFSTIYSLDRVRLLYLMHRPFCWSAINIGWYQFGRQALFNTAIITLVPLLHRCFPGVILAILGAMANITEYTLYAFARTNAHLLIALAVSFGQGLPLNMVRGETSRLIGAEEQGTWFACLAVLENISFSVGIFLISVYTMSLSFYVGLIFNVFAVMTLAMIIFLCIFQHIWTGYTKTLLKCEKVARDFSAFPVNLLQTEQNSSKNGTPENGNEISEEQCFITEPEKPASNC
ncbi:hypothetical protein RRG08_065328 [Elysia crispata]|uniref:Proton-coupled folate transporter n=1 Tax=Elysia crispata TaxID=231223 RepID=A0AAE0YM40_9GAST|nr:hypothetical protein RRG08_065328 [Elysia crispata]